MRSRNPINTSAMSDDDGNVNDWNMNDQKENDWNVNDYQGIDWTVNNWTVNPLLGFESSSEHQ